MDRLLERLKRSGLVVRKAVSAEEVSRLSKGEILSMAQDLSSLTPPEGQAATDATFTYSASISLGGGREECGDIECRRRRLDALVRFAAFYSDRVFIRNPFCGYEHYEHWPVDVLRMSIADDVTLLLHISPLLERGLLSLVSEHFLCMNCLGEALGFGVKSGRRFKQAWNELGDEFLDRVSATVALEGRGIAVETSCPKPYSECDQVTIRHQIPRIVRAKPKMMSQLSKGATVKLPKAMVAAIGIHRDLASRIVHSVAHHVVTNRYLHASFLTDKELELAFLNRASGSQMLERRNAIAMKYLSTLVPCVMDVPVNKLVTLRKREAESFVRFRSVFAKAITEFGNPDTSMSPRIAKQVYGDLIAPQLAKLDDRVRRAKQDLISSTTRPLVGMVGAISFGLLSGTIPMEVAQIAQAVGIAKFGSAFLEKLLAIGDAERAIQQDDFYFLWKIRKAAKSRR